MSPAEAGTPALAQAITRLITETRFTTAAASAAARYAEIDGASLAADAITTWLQTHATANAKTMP